MFLWGIKCVFHKPCGAKMLGCKEIKIYLCNHIIIVSIMTDYEYILQQARKAHYKGWNDEDLRKCVDMLIGLTHEELFTLYTSKWLRGDKVMREEAEVSGTLFVLVNPVS